MRPELVEALHDLGRLIDDLTDEIVKLDQRGWPPRWRWIRYHRMLVEAHKLGTRLQALLDRRDRLIEELEAHDALAFSEIVESF